MDTILQDDLTVCPVCGKALYGNGDWHHIYNGTANRKKSEEDGMKIYVHRSCHMDIHANERTDLYMKAHYMKKWCTIYGKTVDDFIDRYGQNYETRLEEYQKKRKI